MFPVAAGGTVCGFEAFINGRHVVGEVKEKERARKEYREAIARGDGAYLMDQSKESPEVFSIAVGNLPPDCSVIIKITYVTEMPVDRGTIEFAFPMSSVISSSTDGEDATQSELRTLLCESGTPLDVGVTIGVGVDMPFEIVCLSSPSHRLSVKQSTTKAAVQLAEPMLRPKDFVLELRLADMSVPRIWVEEDPAGHRACMLTFTPEFEPRRLEHRTHLIVLDLSCSMAGDGLKTAKRAATLLLDHLAPGTVFNIIAFGTSQASAFPAARLVRQLGRYFGPFLTRFYFILSALCHLTRAA